MSAAHVLLVDDEAAIRQIYRLYLNVQGFEVTTASNAIDAIHEVTTKQFAAIVLDIGLGDTNGMDLIVPIKAVQPHAPIIIFTGQPADEKTRKQAIELGAFQFFTKSHPLDYMVSELKRAIHISRLEAQKHSAA